MLKDLAVALLVLTALQLASSQSVQWIGPFDWAAVSPLDADVLFKCVLEKNSTSLLPENHTVVTGSEQWQLPGDQTLYDGNSTIDNKVIGGETLLVRKVALSDKGIYLCRVQLDCIGQTCESERWFKHALNLNGPLYANLMDKYKTNFIIGAIAGGSMLAILVLLCLVYKLRYKDDYEKDQHGEVNEELDRNPLRSEGSRDKIHENGSEVEESPLDPSEMPGVRVTQYVGANEANTHL